MIYYIIKYPAYTVGKAYAMQKKWKIVWCRQTLSNSTSILKVTEALSEKKN